MRFGQKKPGLQPLPPQLSDAWQARTVTFADWMFLRLRNASLARFSTRLGRANRDRADCLHTSHNVLQCFLTGFVDPGMFGHNFEFGGHFVDFTSVGPLIL